MRDSQFGVRVGQDRWSPTDTNKLIRVAVPSTNPPSVASNLAAGWSRPTNDANGAALNQTSTRNKRDTALSPRSPWRCAPDGCGIEECGRCGGYRNQVFHLRPKHTPHKPLALHYIQGYVRAHSGWITDLGYPACPVPMVGGALDLHTAREVSPSAADEAVYYKLESKAEHLGLIISTRTGFPGPYQARGPRGVQEPGWEFAGRSGHQSEPVSWASGSVHRTVAEYRLHQVNLEIALDAFAAPLPQYVEQPHHEARGLSGPRGPLQQFSFRNVNCNMQCI